MKSNCATLVMTGIMVAVLSSTPDYAEETTPGNKQGISVGLVDRLKAIADIADVAMPERQELLRTINDQVPAAQASHIEGSRDYVRGMLVIIDYLTSCDFGDRVLQDALCQRMVLDCLRFADMVSVGLEFRLVSQLRLGPSRNLDENGQKVSGPRWQAVREQIIGHRLHLWRRINNIVDPCWDPNDFPMINVPVPGGMYRSGVAPEAIKEPEIRKQYEAVLEANNMKAERYHEQRSARNMRDFYLPSLKHAIADAYSMGPVTADDLDVLKAYLRIYVSDTKLRDELLQMAARASEKHPTTRPAEEG